MEAFFSGSEIGVISTDYMKMRHRTSLGSRGARETLKMLERPEWLHSTTLVGTNIAIVTITSLGTLLVVRFVGLEYSWVAIPIVAPIIWIFGEIVPKTIFQQRTNEITPRLIFVLRGFSYLFYPILIVFAKTAGFLAALISGAKHKKKISLRESLLTALQIHSMNPDVHPMAREMVMRSFGFAHMTVKEVMVGLTDVVSVADDACCDDARRQAIHHGPHHPLHQQCPQGDEQLPGEGSSDAFPGRG